MVVPWQHRAALIVCLLCLPASSCGFPGPPRSKYWMGVFGSKGVAYDEEGGVKTCIFCDIYQGKNRLTEVVYQDDETIVFTPLDVCATHHYLVVPRVHIRNVASLTKDDLPKLDRMTELGKKILKERAPDSDPSKHQYCFHVPPFNSIDHLHLHVQVLPFKSSFAARKYSTDTLWCLSAATVRARLEKGLRIPW